MTVREITSINMSALICIPKYVISIIFSGETIILGTVGQDQEFRTLDRGKHVEENTFNVIVCCLYGQFMQENNTQE
jgi:hypothetical protein